MNRGRKITGGKYHKQKKRKKYEIAGQTRIVKLGKEKRKNIRVTAGKIKTFLLSSDTANIIDRKTKKSKKVKIKNVLETPSNRFLARQNILVKGAIIEIEAASQDNGQDGLARKKARITNRPSQEGCVNAVLID